MKGTFKDWSSELPHLARLSMAHFTNITKENYKGVHDTPHCGTAGACFRSVQVFEGMENHCTPWRIGRSRLGLICKRHLDQQIVDAVQICSAADPRTIPVHRVEMLRLEMLGLVSPIGIRRALPA